MNIIAVKFMVALIMNLIRLEIDQMKTDQVVGWLTDQLSNVSLGY